MSRRILKMLGKKSRIAMVAPLVLGTTGAGVVGAQPAEASTACHASWDRTDSYPTGAPNVSTYINDIYTVKVKNCGSGGEMRVDVGPLAVDKCLGYVSRGATKTGEIKVTYQDKAPWNFNPPKPRGVKAGC